MKKNKVIWGVVQKALDNGLLIIADDLSHPAICEWKNLSDFSDNFQKIANSTERHKFLLLSEERVNNVYSVSYKSLHPEEWDSKKKIVPTSSHFYNLRKHMFHKLNSSSIFNNKILELESFKNIYLKNN